MLAIALMGVIIGHTASDYIEPTYESVTVVTRCNKREYVLAEEGGKLILKLGDKTRDLSDTSFYQSYLVGSYVGRFNLLCRHKGEFTYSFYGVDVPAGVPMHSAAGSLTLNDQLNVVADHAIARQEVDLVNLNKRRREGMRSR